MLTEKDEVTKADEERKVVIRETPTDEEEKTRATNEGQLDNGVMHASMTRRELEDRNGEEYGQRTLHTGTGYRAEETRPVMESSEKSNQELPRELSHNNNNNNNNNNQQNVFLVNHDQSSSDGTVPSEASPNTDEEEKPREPHEQATESHEQGTESHEQDTESHEQGTESHEQDTESHEQVTERVSEAHEQHTVRQAMENHEQLSMDLVKNSFMTECDEMAKSSFQRDANNKEFENVQSCESLEDDDVPSGEITGENVKISSDENVQLAVPYEQQKCTNVETRGHGLHEGDKETPSKRTAEVQENPKELSQPQSNQDSPRQSRVGSETMSKAEDPVEHKVTSGEGENVTLIVINNVIEPEIASEKITEKREVSLEDARRMDEEGIQI